ncbi:MAG: UDP-N-acetylmuramoyl-tripeptide--D-alanyl-D-alanine ligase [Paludibacter sp.]|nr:UDP-N-acetylmuramoyl-tripeptide--D-alanyl-D-alanine ligase [Paludibacter sp.]
MHLYPIFLQHPVICIDSRVCPDGSIFFSLKGDNFNANAFALSAIEKGCAYAVVDEPEFAIDERFILVDNVLENLQQLAAYHRKQLGTRIIGITGTNGKTTTKELIATVLNQKYNILYTQGNLNNHIGVPLTLLQLKPEHQIAVIEMGANHRGDIKLLCEIACPDHGIITNVGKAHLEGFGSFEGVKKTKAELYEYIFKHGKNIFINKDNEHLVEMATKVGFEIDKAHVRNYSLDPENWVCYIYGQILDCSPFLNMECTIDLFDKFKVSTKLIGSYNAENVLAAVAIGEYFGLEKKEIKQGLEKYNPQNNRSQLTITNRNKLVVDAYNANPTSMQAAILNFAQMDVEHKTLILGDMLELGEQSAKEHQNVVEILQQNKLEAVLLVGKEFRCSINSFNTFENVNELIIYLTENPINGNYILIKGSRGIQLEKVLASL